VHVSKDGLGAARCPLPAHTAFSSARLPVLPWLLPSCPSHPTLPPNAQRSIAFLQSIQTWLPLIKVL